MRKHLLYFLGILFLFQSCTATQKVPTAENDLLEFTILQINDVYEIAPIEGGAVGGIARVAQVRKELIAENPNTISILSGDFLSPSLMATLKLDGEKIAGLQMVESLNAMGLDYVTFGNHEFDLGDPDLLQKRIDQSEFKYVSCNAMRLQDGKVAPFTQLVDGKREDIPTYLIHDFKTASGRTVKVAILGVVLPFNKQAYVQYLPITETFKMAYEEAQKEADLVIAMTHLNMDEDIQLAKDVPGIPLFMGGHEHVNLNHYIEETIITKADANAKTAYIHRITFNPNTKLSHIKSSLKSVDSSVDFEPTTAAVVKKWEDQVNSILGKMGYDPKEKIMETKEPLVCTEVLIRSQPTNFGSLTCDALEFAFPEADVFFVNSGSMRLDDNLSGTIVEYDVLRTFPFGGALVSMEVEGKTLKNILNIGLVDNVGEGGYFQIKNVSGKKDNWLVGGQAIEDNKRYKLALPQFVADGKEARLGLFADFSYDKQDQLNVNNQQIPNDLRNLVIAYMQTLN